MVVELHPKDVKSHDMLTPMDDEPISDKLIMMQFQEQLERHCWQQGNMKQTAPAQRMADFVNNRLSFDLPSSSYAPGLISSPLHFWMPPFIVKRLQEAFRVFGKRSHGFLTNEAVLIATETRTSSPCLLYTSVCPHPKPIELIVHSRQIFGHDIAYVHHGSQSPTV